MKPFIIIISIIIISLGKVKAQETMTLDPPTGFKNRIFLNIGNMINQHYYFGYERRILKQHFGIVGELGYLKPQQYYYGSYLYSSHFSGMGARLQLRYYPVTADLGKGKVTLSPYLFFRGSFSKIVGIESGRDNSTLQQWTGIGNQKVYSTSFGAGIETIFFKRLSFDVYTGLEMNFPNNMHLPGIAYPDYYWSNRPYLRWQSGCLLGFKF